MDNHLKELYKSKEVLLHLLKCAILNENIKLDLHRIDFKDLFSLAQKHGVDNILYYTLKNAEAPKDIMLLCQKSLFIATALDSRQEHYVKLLSQKFSENNIKFMFLKGQILKELYPSSDMRKSGDIDILFENRDSEKVRKLMEENGFETVEYGEHHIHDEYKKDGVLIEMHRSLISEKYFEWGKMCKRIEKSWVLKNGCEYVLNNEDYYLYMIAHMAKHMKYGGIGIRFILDLWIYLDKYENVLNWEYINKELEKSGLILFEQSCKKLSRVWFKGEEYNDVTYELGNYIVTGGLFGLKSRYVLSDYVINRGAKKITLGGQIKRFFKASFLPYGQIKGKYSILVKFPILLPFCWIHRIFRAAFFKRGRVKEIANYFDNIDVSDAEKMKNFKESIGL